MNTLPRAITAPILTTPQTYWSLRRRWSELVRSPRKHKLSAAHHLLYLALLGKDWRRGFTCITNRAKLENGAFYGWGLFRAMDVLHMPSCEVALLAPFDGLVPFQNKYSYRPEQFTMAGFPFEAYSPPTSA